jgi:hypothetical protein
MVGLVEMLQMRLRGCATIMGAPPRLFKRSNQFAKLHLGRRPELTGLSIA